MKTKILIVEDDKHIAELIKLYVDKDGYDSRICYNGSMALREYDNYRPDIVLLDLMLPEIDGFEVCRRIRGKANTPIILLTARGETFDKVLGLELGADDYIVKPFEPKELMARVKAILRRTMQKPQVQEEVIHGSIRIDIKQYVVECNGKKIEMPPKELELLHILASNPNIVFTREQLLEKVWDYDYIGDSRTVDVHVKRLREKLDGKNKGWEIKTVWGVGYKFEVNDEE